jgi:hypothetical protein
LAALANAIVAPSGRGVDLTAIVDVFESLGRGIAFVDMWQILGLSGARTEQSGRRQGTDGHNGCFDEMPSAQARSIDTHCGLLVSCRIHKSAGTPHVRASLGSLIATQL